MCIRAEKIAHQAANHVQMSMVFRPAVLEKLHPLLAVYAAPWLSSYLAVLEIDSHRDEEENTANPKWPGSWSQKSAEEELIAPPSWSLSTRTSK